jgi:UDP-N-acetylmuramyl pentapeptide synthase
MNQWIAKKIIEKHNPTLVLIMGSSGKSMLSETMSQVLSRLQKTSTQVFADDIKTMMVNATGGGMFNSLKPALLNSSFPEIIIAETHNYKNGQKELLGSIENKYIFIPWVSQYDIQQAGSPAKYLSKKCRLTKTSAKEFTIIYNKDVTGLEEAIQALAPKKALSISARTDQADFKAFGIESIQADDAHITNDYRVQGLNFKVKNGGATLPMRIMNTVGEHYVYSALVTLLFIKEIGLNQVDALPIFREMELLPGRMFLIPGIKKTMLIDDSYSIDAESAYETFQAGSQIALKEGKKRIAVVSDMNTYGKDSEQAHCLLGDELFSLNYDLLVGVGERAHDILRCAHEAGMDASHIHHFTSVEEAGKFVQHELKQGDLVVIKGGKDSKLELVVKELMAFPLKAKDQVLQRQ